jgi:hypothetical protein
MICYLELKRVWTVSEQRILAMAEGEQVVLHGAVVLGAPSVYGRGGHQGPYTGSFLGSVACGGPTGDHQGRDLGDRVAPTIYVFSA